MRSLLLTCFVSFLSFSSFNERKLKVKLPDEFAKIPAGTFTIGDSTARITISGFYMSKYEVTNLQYRQFFAEVSPGMSNIEKEKIICDTLGWSNISTHGAPLKEYYYSHPAYNNYPVVNISYEGAAKYCEWLQKKIQNDNPRFEIEINLPTREQWVWAARGGRSQAMFPWGNYYLRNRKGEFLCNFKKVGDQSIVRNRKTGKPEVMETISLMQNDFYTANVKSFYPNDFGLYNMCGNAAEMIFSKGICVGGSWNDYGGDIHILSQAEYGNPAPTVGFRPIIIVKEKSKP